MRRPSLPTSLPSCTTPYPDPIPRSLPPVSPPRRQFLARIAIQFDIADITAIILVPTLVTVCVWRDGFFSLQDTSVLVRDCELPYIWRRFLVLLLIKPASFAVTQCAAASSCAARALTMQSVRS